MPHRSKPSRSDTLRLSQEFNEKYFNEIRKNIEINDFTIIKDDVSNYRPLTEIQLSQLETLTEKEKMGYHIAKVHLGMSFQLEKSVGFLAWKENFLRNDSGFQ